MAEPRLDATAENWVETIAHPAYRTNAIAQTRRNRTVTKPREFMREFLKMLDTNPASIFNHADTDEWTRERLGDYLNRLANQNMLPAEEVDTGQSNDYPYTG